MGRITAAASGAGARGGLASQRVNRPHIGGGGRVAFGRQLVVQHLGRDRRAREVLAEAVVQFPADVLPLTLADAQQFLLQTLVFGNVPRHTRDADGAMIAGRIDTAASESGTVSRGYS